jgi:cytochrome P450
MTTMADEVIERMNDPTDWWHKLFPKRGKNALNSIATIDKLLAEIIEERRAHPRSINADHDAEDLLDILINAEEADTNNQKSKLTKQQIRDHAMTFFLAGKRQACN